MVSNASNESRIKKIEAHMKRTFLTLLLIILSGASISGAQELKTQQAADWPSLMTDINITQALNFCGEPVALRPHAT